MCVFVYVCCTVLDGRKKWKAEERKEGRKESSPPRREKAKAASEFCFDPACRKTGRERKKRGKREREGKAESDREEAGNRERQRRGEGGEREKRKIERGENERQCGESWR